MWTGDIRALPGTPPLWGMLRLSVAALTRIAVADGTAQVASEPGEPLVQGIRPTEAVYLSGAGSPDLMLEGRAERRPDPAQGLEGWYQQVVRTVPGTALLYHSTRHQSRLVELAEGETLDTALLAARLHYQQLSWGPEDGSTELRILQQAFGPGIREEAAIWTGTGMQPDGALVLRRTEGRRTWLASFRVRFTLPAGTVSVVPVETIEVPYAYGRKLTPASPLPKDDPFGHGTAYQRVIPPGVPPDEEVDLDGDGVPEVVLVGHTAYPYGNGDGAYHVRGIAPAPGAALLMAQHGEGIWTPFNFPTQGGLRPEQLQEGLANGILRWTEEDGTDMVLGVLEHDANAPGGPVAWHYAEGFVQEPFVVRYTTYGRPMWAAFRVVGILPGGELYLELLTFAEEGEVLRAP